MQINFVYITVGSMEEARTIGRELVESKLAAGVNLINNIHSIYIWEGEIRENSETVLIAKTVASRVPALVDKVKEIHSYDCPCIVSLPISSEHHPYLDWVAAHVD